MTHFIALFLMSIGSFFVAPVEIVSEENNTSITTINHDKGDDIIRMDGGAGNWDDQ